MVNVTLTTEQWEIVLRGLAKISINRPDVWKVMDVFYKARDYDVERFLRDGKGTS
jgi:hypothetical protein